MILSKLIEVVKVSADLFRRVHRRKNFNVASSQIEVVRQRAQLDIRRHVQLSRYFFAGGCLFLEIRHVFLELVCHGVEARRQMFYLVIAGDLDFLVEVAAGNFTHAVSQNRQLLSHGVRYSLAY